MTIQGPERGVAAVEGAGQELAYLRRSEERFRGLIHSTADAIVSADASGRIVLWNAAAGRMFGFSAEDVVGRPLTVLMPESLREPHERGLRRFLSSGEARVIGRTVELEGLRRNGTTCPIELSLSTWTTSDGSRYFTGIIRDVTERRRAQEKLAHQALHDSLTGLPNRTLVLDRLGQALARSARHEWSVGVPFFDLDRFKV